MRGGDRVSTVLHMSWIEGVAWGLAGGLAAGLSSLMSAVHAVDYRWPAIREQVALRLFVMACGFLLGALVAAALHGQIRQPWHAFSIGVCARSAIRETKSRDIGKALRQ